MATSKYLLITLILLLAVGCSGRTGDPATPGLAGSGINHPVNHSSSHLWGVWNVEIDQETHDVEIIPVRGADYAVDIVKFLQPPQAPGNLLQINLDPSSDFPNGYVVVDVTLVHPFPGYKKFSGFDVRGIVISNGSLFGIADNGIIYGGDEAITLNNADGMTRWYNPVEFLSQGSIWGFTEGALGSKDYAFTGTLNSYKYFCSGLDATASLGEFFNDPGNPNPRGVFYNSDSNTRRYELQFPIIGGFPVFKFQYAIQANWETPLIDPPDNVPDDFSLSANSAEAFCISAADLSDMYYKEPGDFGGSLIFDLQIFDHQGLMNSTGVIDEISAIHLETPSGLITTGGIASFDYSSLLANMTAFDPQSVSFHLEVTDVEPAGEGDFPVLIVVESNDPDSYDQGIPGVIVPDGILSAYFMAKAHVGSGGVGEPPVADAIAVTSPPYCPGDSIEFDASGSYDPDGGSIVSYEWDFDGDGIYGDSYDSGTDGNPVLSYGSSGTHMIDVRVMDDEGMTDTLDIPIGIDIGGATWVDDDGDPGTADGTYDNPWPTIQQGIDNAFDGCGGKFIKVREGTYIENIIVSTGTVIEGADSVVPLLQSPPSSVDPLVTMNGVNDSALRYFDMKPGTASEAITLSGNNNEIKDITLIDNPGGDTCSRAISASGTDNTVDGVYVDGYTASTSGFISMSGAGSQMINNVILNLNWNAASSGTVMSLSNGGSTALIAKNVIGHIQFTEAFVSTEWVRMMSIGYGNEGCTVRNNLIFDINNNLGDTGWTWGIDASDATDMTFEHNTVSVIYGPAWIYAFETSDFNVDPTNVTHQSHIITDLSSAISMWRWAYLGSWNSDLPVDYSCAYNVGQAFRDEVVQGLGFVNSDPQFMDKPNDDYRVSNTSPCHNSAHDGTDMGAYGGTDPLTWLP